MSKDKMREEFEAAFAKETASRVPHQKEAVLKAHGGFESILLDVIRDDRAGDTYRTDMYATAWWAWQASRAAVVVELPDSEELVGEYSREVYRIARDEFCEAIEAAGLKVAP